MSKDLLESILNKDYLVSKDLFENRLSEIAEKKLYEEKRRISAKMNEAVGGLTNKEIEARKKAGYKKASDILGDPREKNKSGRLNPSAKIIKKKTVEEEQIEEAGLAPTKIGKYIARPVLKTGRALGGLYGKYKASKIQSTPDDEHKDLRKTFDAQRPDEKQRPGVIRRNVNTLMGRSPSYEKPETPESEKGGRAGKAVRMAGKGVGKAWGLWGDVLSRGMSGPLE